MKLLKITMQGLPHFKEVVEVDFLAQQRVADDDKEQLYNIFGNFYTNKVISFIGVNASGKTRTLKALSFAMKMLSNIPLNNIKSRDILKDLGEDQETIITSYFYNQNCIKKLETVIKRKIDSSDGISRLFICDETLWSKEAVKVKTKKSLFEFSDKDYKTKRNNDEQYLLEDVSIIIAENNKDLKIKKGLDVVDTFDFTEHNYLNTKGTFPDELLAFLDPSIEYLECNGTGKQADIRLKFRGSDEIILNSMELLQNYLSSGTIKGLNLFTSAVVTFIKGGYLIVDEIENHFNKEIVATLIRFFMDKKVNRNAGTLIFSTHYSELLDEFDRGDSIYIVRNNGGINTEKLSNVLKRNDIKKSDVYDSGYLGGTTPAYDNYIALKKVLQRVFWED